MQRLRAEIEERLTNRPYCTIFENDLSRVWPERSLKARKKRKQEIEAFAKANQWLVAFHENDGLEAIFRKQKDAARGKLGKKATSALAQLRTLASEGDRMIEELEKWKDPSPTPATVKEWRTRVESAIKSKALSGYITRAIYAQWSAKYPYSDGTDRFAHSRGVYPTHDKLEAYRLLEDRVTRLKQLIEKIAVLLVAISITISAR